MNVSLTAEAALKKLIQLGIDDAHHVASGMEGHIFRVGNRTVAKVWYCKSPAEVESLRRFYTLLQTLDLPFRTPQIVEVRAVDDTTVSLERELTGTPLRDLIGETDLEPPTFACEAVLNVLGALKDSFMDHDSPLAVLGVTPSRRARFGGPTAILLEVADQKVRRYGDQLRRSVPGFDQIYSRTVHHLLELPVTGAQAVHGDLCPENILLDEEGKVAAVLDWGFLSLLGDAALDASVACGVYNMYGPHHRELDETFLTACQERLGYSRERLLLYRALYAIVSSNAYAEDGRDGQYAWCVENLLRDDLRSVLSSERIR